MVRCIYWWSETKTQSKEARTMYMWSKTLVSLQSGQSAVSAHYSVHVIILQVYQGAC